MQMNETGPGVTAGPAPPWFEVGGHNVCVCVSAIQAGL